MRLHATIFIQRPIIAVFDYMSTPGNIPNWVTGVTVAEGPTPEEQGVGAMFVLDSDTQLGTVRSAWEVIAFEPPRSLALRRLDQAVEVRWTLQGLAGEATRILVEADLIAVSFFRPGPSQLEELGNHQLNDDLDVLRRRLEEQPVRPQLRTTSQGRDPGVLLASEPNGQRAGRIYRPDAPGPQA